MVRLPSSEQKESLDPYSYRESERNSRGGGGSGSNVCDDTIPGQIPGVQFRRRARSRGGWMVDWLDACVSF